MTRARALVALGVTAAALLMSTGAWPGSAQADARLQPFTALARADALRAHVTATGFVASDLGDVSGPSAQAKLDSLGDSEGFAAFPYPGDTAVSGPGLVVALAAPQLGVPAPQLPSYPLAARSQYPAPRDVAVTWGPVQLSAHSAERSSSGHAVGGAGDSGGNSVGFTVAGSSVSVAESGTLISDATAMVEAVTLGGILRIGAMRASAHVEAPSTGRPTATSAFSVEGVTVAGTPVGLDDQGFVMAGTHQPLPPSSSLAQALAASGISVAYLEPATDGGGVQSGGLSITVPQRTPNGNLVTVTYTFGVVRADIFSQALPSRPLSTGPLSPSSQRPRTAANSPGSRLSTAAGAGETADNPLATDISRATALDRGMSRRVPASARRGVRTSTTSVMSVYLLIVVGAVMALGGSLALRLFAVRLLWTS